MVNIAFGIQGNPELVDALLDHINAQWLKVTILGEEEFTGHVADFNDETVFVAPEGDDDGRIPLARASVVHIQVWDEGSAG